MFLSCLGIVIWQCSKCLTKFLSKPQGTQLSVVNSVGNMFPSVTICPYPDPNENTIYNSTILLDCGITGSQYFFVWSNKTIEKYRNPKSLYYNIIWKLDELVSKVIIHSINTSSIVYEDKTALFSPIYTHNYGRCYTFLPPEQNLIDGIYRLRFILKAKARIFVGNNGVFGVKVSAENNFLDISPSEKYHVTIDHNLYKMLDFQGVPCNYEKGYRLDKCVLNGLEKESLKKIGCVSPFGITKDNICQDELVAKKAFQLYKTFRYNYRDLKILSCLEPCTYMSVKIMKASEMEKVGKDKTGVVLLHFNEQVHETVAYYSYDELSFIAEIGGYVGLFLGASIYQTADLFQFLTGVLQRFSNKD